MVSLSEDIFLGLKSALQFYLPVYLVVDINGQLFTADPTCRLCISLTPLRGCKKLPKSGAAAPLEPTDD
jgi:hypothetical protein